MNFFELHKIDLKKTEKDLQNYEHLNFAYLYLKFKYWFILTFNAWKDGLAVFFL